MLAHPTIRTALPRALALLLAAGCILPRALEPSADDRRAVVTIEDFDPWVARLFVALSPEAETLRKQKVAWSYVLSYEFSGIEAAPDAEPMRVFLQSEVSVHPNSPSALHNANTYWVGLKAGLWKGGASLERVTPTLDWGDGVDSFKIHKDETQIGNLVIGHVGNVATYVLITGVYSSDPSQFEALLQTKLRALEHYDPSPPAETSRLVGEGVP